MTDKNLPETLGNQDDTFLDKNNLTDKSRLCIDCYYSDINVKENKFQCTRLFVSVLDPVIGMTRKGKVLNCYGERKPANNYDRCGPAGTFFIKEWRDK